MWKAPLKKGLYRIFPKDVSLTHSNYPLLSDNNILYFEEAGFMPKADWEFSWL